MKNKLFILFIILVLLTSCTKQHLSQPSTEPTAPSQPTENLKHEEPKNMDSADAKSNPYRLLSLKAEDIAAAYGPMTYVTTWWGGSPEYKLEKWPGVSVLFNVYGYYDIHEFPYYLTPCLVWVTEGDAIIPGIAPGMRQDQLSEEIHFLPGWTLGGFDADSRLFIRTFETGDYAVDVYYPLPSYVTDYYFGSPDAFTPQKEKEFAVWADHYLNHMQDARIRKLKLYKKTMIEGGEAP